MGWTKGRNLVLEWSRRAAASARILFTTTFNICHEQSLAFEFQHVPAFIWTKSAPGKKIERIERGLVILWWYGYGSIPIDTFLVGWTSINPSTFGVHQGYKVLTHSHIVVIRGLVEIGREMSGLPSGSFLHRQHGRPVQSCHGLHWSIQIGVDQKWWFPWDLWLAK